MLILQDRNGVPKCRVDPPNDLIFVSDTYKLYCAHGLEEPKDYILRIPTNIGGNTQVNQEAEILRYLRQRSELLEQKYSELSAQPLIFMSSVILGIFLPRMNPWKRSMSADS